MVEDLGPDIQPNEKYSRDTKAKKKYRNCSLFGVGVSEIVVDGKRKQRRATFNLKKKVVQEKNG